MMLDMRKSKLMALDIPVTVENNFMHNLKWMMENKVHTRKRNQPQIAEVYKVPITDSFLP